MSEIDDVAAKMVRPLATTARNVVPDAFRLVLDESEEYVESEVALEKLEFASFAVGGLGAVAGAPGPAEVRSSSSVEVPLSDSAGGSGAARTTVTLFGPGDVLGIDPAQFVRRYPAPGTQTAEETVLAHVEFNRPELPWAFSPPGPGGALQPWVALIVVEKRKVRFLPAMRLLPVLEVPRSELPQLSSAHTWAHTQAPQSDSGVPLGVRLSPEYAPVNLSRLVSARVLRQDTDYVAAVVPTTDVGVQSGLGRPGGRLTDAWTTTGADPVLLPVYDSWEFRTGPDGDFRTLALRLHGVVAPYEVGRRFLDASEPGEPLESLPDGAAGAKQVIRCALFSRTPPSSEAQQTAEAAVWPEPMVERLREELDLPARIEGAEEPTESGIPDLPILGPRIYAQLHRGSPVITGTDWFAEVNLAPTRRVMAGLGTRVVQQDQEQLMQAAWAQVGEVEKANRAIRLAQLAELLATRVHKRLDSLQQGRVLQLAAPLAQRISVQGGRSLAADIAASATPATAVAGAFRRATRPSGPMLRRAGAASRERAGALVGGDAQLRDFTRVYRNPDGVGEISAASIGQLDARSVAVAIDVSPDDVTSVLTRASAEIRGGLVGYLSDPSGWRAPEPDFDLGAILTEDWGRHILKETTIPALAHIRAQRVGPLAAELVQSRPGRASGMHERLEREAIEINNGLLTRVGRVRDDDVVVRGREDDVVVRGRVVRVRRTSPFGTTIGRGMSTRAGLAVRVGRRPSPIDGVFEFDTSVLTRVVEGSGAVPRAEALGALARLAVRPVTPMLDRIDELPVDVLRSEMTTLIDPGGVLQIDKVPRRETLAAGALLEVLRPERTVRAALNGRLRLSDVFLDRWSANRRMAEIVAAPHFDRPMYQALHAYDKDWLIPGLDALPDSDFVTVLSTNSEFMEAFFLGLSDEMGRELLWRNYPTDQRGTYFRRFWDAHQDELRRPIHAFSGGALGSHISVGGSGGSEGRAVVLVKSELVRRFPDLIIQVVRNQGTEADPVFERPGSPQQTAEQLFSAFLDPDIALVGVDLSVDEIDQPQWWILIAEHPTATRFERPPDDDIPAGHEFVTVPGAGNGASFAERQVHRPVRVAFQGADVIVTEG
jgi:hypothetical protein